MALIHEMISTTITVSNEIIKIDKRMNRAEQESYGFKQEWFKEVYAARQRVYRNRRAMEKNATDINFIIDKYGMDSEEFRKMFKDIEKCEQAIVWGLYIINKNARRFGIIADDMEKEPYPKRRKKEM